MTCRCKKARQAAETVAEEVLEQGSHTLSEVINYVAPRARHAGQHAVEVVVPVFEDARGRLVPAFADARERIVPLVSEVVDRVPPAVHQAYDSVSEKVAHEVYPKLHELWDQANENPTVAEASRRGRSAVAALRGDIAVPEPAPVVVRRNRGLVGKIFAAVGLAALVGAIFVAVRAILGNSDDGWSPQEPMRPATDDAEWGTSPFETEPDVDTSAAATVAQAEQEMVAEGGAVDDGLGHAARAEQNYGEGAYVGAEPPEGFAIKGNERSMKYHTPEAAGYDRTNADVWFASEAAAQAAGFTRALR